MIYRLIRPWAKLSCLLYFRKIFLINAEAMPRKGPLMVVCNHPSSFFEACLMAVMLPRPLYFLTRGDFFRNKLFAWFLRQTHQVPIFRSEDGFDKLRANQDTFGYCYAALKENKVIIIFPETKTETEKRLRPVQKGAARIALGALKQIGNAEALNILPVGITFSDPTKYRSLATLRCGTIITIKAEAGDEREQIIRITATLEKALKSLIIHIEDPAREKLFDSVQSFLFNSSGSARFPVVSRSHVFPDVEQDLESRINALSNDQAAQLAQAASQYKAELRRQHLKDRHLYTIFSQSLIGSLLLILVLPIVLMGKVITFLPSWLIHDMLKKRIKRIPFYGPTKWALGMLSYGFLFLLMIICGWAIWGISGLIGAAFLVMTGFLNLQYFHDLNIRGLIAILTLSRKRRNALLVKREELLALVRSTKPNPA